MKKVCAGLVLFVLVTGCQGDADSTDLANSSVKGEKFHPIEPKEQGDLEVIGWFDNQTILYLLSGEDSFEMYRHDIFTGDDELLYSDDQSFHRLDANYNHTRFALQTLNDQDQAELIILNANGEVSSTPTLEADDYSIYWSPYDEAEFMAVAFLPDWKQEVYHIQLDPLSIDKTGIQSSYLQWSSPDSVSYLNWSMIPSIEAPLKQYELSSSKITDGYGSGLFYANLYQDRSVLVKYKEIHANEILYEFTDGMKKLGSLTIPALNTFSEQWWITSYAFDGLHDIFYYLRPQYSADYVSYKDGFELLAYDLNDDSYTNLGHVDHQEPLVLSDDGKWILTGSNKQKLMNTNDGSVFKLF